MNYPIVLHKDKDSDYGVTVPDLPGCFSAGSTIDEALAMAKEAIELHLEGLVAEGQSIPAARPIDKHQQRAEYRGGTWAVVSIDPSGLRINAVRINITVPERVLDAVDRFAERHGRTRSGLLVEAVTDYIGRQGDQPPTSPRRKSAATKSRRNGT